MRSLYSILESIQDDDEKVSRDTLIGAAYETVKQALTDCKLINLYKCEIINNQIVISFGRSSAPAIWESLTYDYQEERVYKGNGSSGMTKLPLDIFKICHFNNCMLRLKTNKVVDIDAISRCTKSYIFLFADATSMSTSELGKYIISVSKYAKYTDGNALCIDPKWSDNDDKDVSFLSGADFNGFKQVRLPFNLNAYTLVDVTARNLVLGTWSVVKSSRPGIEQFKLVDYRDGADWQTEDRSRVIDQIIRTNNITRFAVNSNHTQYDMYFVWNRGKGMYDTKLIDAGSIRAPKVNR